MHSSLTPYFYIVSSQDISSRPDDGPALGAKHVVYPIRSFLPYLVVL
jgi:hypothetical protein